MKFHEHIAYIENHIGGKLHKIRSEILHWDIYFYGNGISEKSKYLDGAIDSPFMAAVICCFERARNDKGNLLFPPEKRKQILSEGDDGSYLGSAYADIGRQMMKKDNELLSGASDLLGDAIKNSQAQQANGSTS